LKFCILSIFVMIANISFASDMVEVKACLNKFKDHPFDKKNPKFRTINAKVKVFGIGGELADYTKSEKPELILVKPSVNVMGKSVYKFLNPNGWYCLKASVTVMAKTVIRVNCNSKLAAVTDGVAVLASSSDDRKGVNVLGSMQIERVGNCKKSK